MLRVMLHVMRDTGQAMRARIEELEEHVDGVMEDEKVLYRDASNRVLRETLVTETLEGAS